MRPFGRYPCVFGICIINPVEYLRNEFTADSPLSSVSGRAARARLLVEGSRLEPETVRHLVATLRPSESRALALEHPTVVGALDGAPPELRYLANRRAMHLARCGDQHSREGVLLFSARGGGRVAQVFGDLATAERVAVLCPGAGNRGSNFWTGLGGLRHRSPALQAARVYDAVCAGGPEAARVAVIAWLGYDTPAGLGVDVARAVLARAGAVALRRLVAGLVVTSPGATIVLLGHSYGSVVIGAAASHLPRQVTDLVVFGSPGMGVRNAGELRTSARVWAGQARRDWVRWVPGLRLLGVGHGTKPAHPAFGASALSTADVPDHDHYLSPGTDALAHVARIVGWAARTRSRCA